MHTCRCADLYVRLAEVHCMQCSIHQNCVTLKNTDSETAWVARCPNPRWVAWFEHLACAPLLCGCNICWNVSHHHIESFCKQSLVWWLLKLCWFVQCLDKPLSRGHNVSHMNKLSWLWRPDPSCILSSILSSNPRASSAAQASLKVSCVWLLYVCRSAKLVAPLTWQNNNRM